MKLVHFTADWCQPCKRMQPVIEEFIATYSDIEYIKIDIDKNQDLLTEYSEMKPVMSVPTFFAINNNELIASKTGVGTKEDLAKLFS